MSANPNHSAVIDRRYRVRAGVAFGSNIGDRLANLIAARKKISEIPGVNPPVISSPVYETDPVGCEPGAAGFLNAVIEFPYAGEPLELFGQLKQIEIELGRPAEHARNVSRSIDIDLLYFGDTVLNTEHLSLPHPRMVDRVFVLQPLADIQPERVLPSQTKTVRELLASAAQTGKVERATVQWEG
ncbi:MAG TPA: 2-amino-4-hydroxy-6-hydroxymethyldihydropteridine diphosphokinase [Chthoniobacterales bacterium]|jgi:2-amino-4-hydroxy-6-hydroxymethyldihydropteridine diphosphokinase